MIAVGGIGGLIRDPFQFVGIEDIVDPPDAFELTEGVLIAPAGIAESIGQRAFHPVIGIGGRGIVEVATYHDRVGGTTDLFGDIIGLRRPLPEVLFHLQDQLDTGFQAEHPGLGSCLYLSAVLVHTGCLQVVTEEADGIGRHTNIGDHRQIDGVLEIEGPYMLQGIPAADHHRQVVGTSADAVMGDVAECFPNGVSLVVGSIGGFLHTDNIGLQLADISRRFPHRLLSVPKEMGGVVGHHCQGLSAFGQGIPSGEGWLPDSQQVVGMQQDCQQGQPYFPTVTGKELYNHLQGIKCQYSPDSQRQEGKPDQYAVSIVAAEPSEKRKEWKKIIHILSVLLA